MEDIMRTIYSLEEPVLMKLIKGVSETTENESKILCILLGTWLQIYYEIGCQLMVEMPSYRN